MKKLKLSAMEKESKENSVEDRPKVVEEEKFEQWGSNNHHVVPFGILMVLCTIYLTLSGLHINYTYYFRPGVAASKQFEPNADFQDENQSLLETKINLERQQQSSCSNTEVFIRKEENSFNRINQSIRKQKQSKSSKSGLTGLVSGGKQSKTSNKKKDNSKNINTAEPIIYLFALVFIYLLLKAASDINQHYKLQKKGDKRLRRCSLQSYAMTHQDRRASKDFTMPKVHSGAFRSDFRSQSLDRYEYSVRMDVVEITQIGSPNRMKNNSSFDEQPRSQYGRPMHPAVNNLQLYGERSEPLHRRASVPVNSNLPRVRITKANFVDVGKLIANPNLFGSVTNLTTLNWPQPETPNPEPKRRVRMINRH